MSTCSRCQTPYAADALACPHCGLALKAHGHPGIQLHRAQAGQFLCKSCIYEQDDSCTYPQRPYAEECTLYRDIHKPQRQRNLSNPSGGSSDLSVIFLNWCRRNSAGLVLLGILLLAVLITLRR